MLDLNGNGGECQTVDWWKKNGPVLYANRDNKELMKKCDIPKK
jgi:hypothetical protein